MARSRWNRQWKPRRRKPVPPNPTIYHLDTFSLEDVRQWKQGQDEFIRVHWEKYSELAYQRSKILGEIKASLTEAAIGPFEFSEYQRAVKAKWVDDPLSIRGSVAHIGGRFNIGDIDRTKFSPFPALYLSQDKSTALQELFQVEPKGEGEFTGEELTLTKADSVGIFSVFGSLETIIDLYQIERLQGFVNLIKDFSLSESVKKSCTRLGIPTILVNETKNLKSAVLEENWRAYPMHVDVPANCQLLGQLIYEAGIEGIKYPSKYPGKDCLAIFPSNFQTTDSFVKLAGELPESIIRRRLDSQNRNEF